MDEKSQMEQAQIERARRLREKINELTGGAPANQPDEPKSIKEQIAERVSELEKEKKEGQ